jgi:uncharacterized RDD family membrane protein YckC
MGKITILNASNVPMGPFTREQVTQKLQAGEVSLASLAHVEGLAQWTKLSDVLVRVDAAAPPAVPASSFSVPPAGTPAYSYAATMQPPSHLVYAGFWLRFVAVFIDGIILAVPMGIIGAIVGGAIGFSYGMSHPGGTFSIMDGDGDFNSTFILMEVGLMIFSTIVKWLYFALQESSSAQATVGKRVMGLKVMNLAGQRIGFGQASGRFFSKIISGMILCIGYIMAGFTERKQALHDMIAGTLVVRE